MNVAKCINHEQKLKTLNKTHFLSDPQKAMLQSGNVECLERTLCLLL